MGTAGPVEELRSACNNDGELSVTTTGGLLSQQSPADNWDSPVKVATTQTKSDLPPNPVMTHSCSHHTFKRGLHFLDYVHHFIPWSPNCVCLTAICTMQKFVLCPLQCRFHTRLLWFISKDNGGGPHPLEQCAVHGVRGSAHLLPTLQQYRHMFSQ